MARTYWTDFKRESLYLAPMKLLTYPTLRSKGEGLASEKVRPYARAS